MPARQRSFIREIFFDPQTHTERGIGFGTVVGGITQALQQAEQELGISSQLIMCFTLTLMKTAHVREHSNKPFHIKIKS
ncbi:hypothetical protein O9929_08605 [Vibrio lentus]|nr:hypothetical protein [Vibrio lentus]